MERFGSILGLLLMGWLLTPLSARSEVLPHVRPLDRIARITIADGLKQSPSIRSLIDRLDSSDVFVYVDVAPDFNGLAGRMRFLSRAGGHRYLRVTLNPNLAPADRLAILGHELQHAVEVATHAEVNDEDGMRTLYEKIGEAMRYTADHFETAEAWATGERVRSEIHAAQPTLASVVALDSRRRP